MIRRAKLGKIQGDCRFDKGGGVADLTKLQKNLNFYAIKMSTF